GSSPTACTTASATGGRATGGSSSGCLLDVAGEHVAEDEAVAGHDLAELDVDRCTESGAVEHEGVELAALPTWVDRWREVSQQLFVERPARELGCQLRGVDARQHGLDRRGDHLPGQRPRRPLP